MKNIILLLFFICNTLVAQQSTASANVFVISLHSPQLQCDRKIWIYLPENYSQTKKKYPVIYMHDGQNLFDAQTSYAGEWNIDETLNEMKANVIVIGIENGSDKRLEELTPYKNEKYGGGRANLYLEFIVNTVKPYIDKNYRTKLGAKNTCIWGSSLGGLVSLYAAIKYPKVFGKVGCFSPAFWINRNDFFALLDQTKSLNTKIYFLCGDNEGDDDMIKDLNTVEYKIDTIRCHCKMLNKKVIIPNGQHNEKLWCEGFKNAYLWLF